MTEVKLTPTRSVQSRWDSFCPNVFPDDSWRSVREELQPPGVGSQGGAEALAIFRQLIFDEGASGTLAVACPLSMMFIVALYLPW